MWTHFWDMHSGGDQKEKWNHIYIEAPKEEARVIFFNRFGHNPDRVTCTCCGNDYSISSEDDIAQLTAFHRHCDFEKSGGNKEGKFIEKGGGHWVERVDPGFSKFEQYIPLKEYMENEGKERDIRLFIHAKDIKPKERQGKIPQQGYVWVD